MPGIKEKLDQIISILIKIEENTTPNFKSLDLTPRKNAKKPTLDDRAKTLAERLKGNHQKSAKRYFDKLESKGN